MSTRNINKADDRMYQEVMAVYWGKVEEYRLVMEDMMNKVKKKEEVKMIIGDLNKVEREL